MVSVVGYSADALIAQVIISYALFAALLVTLFLRSYLVGKGMKWYWVLMWLVVGEAGLVLLFFTSIRIGEVMLLNGLLVGAMIMAVIDGFDK